MDEKELKNNDKRLEAVDKLIFKFNQYNELYNSKVRTGRVFRTVDNEVDQRFKQALFKGN